MLNGCVQASICSKPACPSFWCSLLMWTVLSAFPRMSESPEDRKHEADAEEVREEDEPAREDKEEDKEDEDVRDADEEHVNGVEKDKERDERSPSPRARSESRDRDVSRSPASRSPVLRLLLTVTGHGAAQALDVVAPKLKHRWLLNAQVRRDSRDRSVSRDRRR